MHSSEHCKLYQRIPTGSFGGHSQLDFQLLKMHVPHPKLRFEWRRLIIIGVGMFAFLLSGCADVAGPFAGEPTNACLLAAINERAVLRAKNYMQPNVEAHLLAIWFQESRHVALVVKGDTRWFAWDDAYGGRPLILKDPRQLPDAMSAAKAAFPRKTVNMAWWVD